MYIPFDKQLKNTIYVWLKHQERNTSACFLELSGDFERAKMGICYDVDRAC